MLKLAILLVAVIALASSASVSAQQPERRYFTLFFVGSVYNGSSATLHASATSTTFTTLIDGQDGFTSTVKTQPGPLGVWEGNVTDFKQSGDLFEFKESGNLSFGTRGTLPHVLNFSGSGAYFAADSQGNLLGTGVFRITGGEGAFAKADGWINANYHGSNDPKDPTKIDVQTIVSGSFVLQN